MTIAVDFDGTIVEHRFPSIGRPRPFAFETLKALAEEGHHLILWTNREDKYLDEAVEFCRQHGVEFYAINSEFPDAAWSGSGVSRKVVADVYIDDKNLGGLPDWGDIYTMISNKSDKAKLTSNAYDPNREHHHHHHEHHHHHRHRFVPELLVMFVTRCREAKSNFKI